MAIDDPVERSYCEMMAGEGVDDSSSLESDPELQDIIRRAYEDGDESICYEIQNPPQRQYCLDYVS